MRKLFKLADQRFALLIAFSGVMFILCIGTLCADTLNVTLDDCIDLAFEQGPDAQSAQLDSISAAGRWRSAAAQSYPQLSFRGSLPSLRDATDYDIIYDPDTGTETYQRIVSSDETWLGRLEIEQALPWGATAGISTRLYRSRWQNDRLGTGIDTIEHSLVRRFEIEQPLLAGNPVARQRKTGRLRWEGALISHEIRNREIRYRVTRSFFSLVSTERALEIARQDLESGKASEELARRKLNAGLVPEVELLQIQVDLARREGSYRRTVSRLESARDQLRRDLGLRLDTPLKPVWNPDASRLAKMPPVDESAKPLELEREELNLSGLEMETRASRLSERVRASLLLYVDLETRRHDLKYLTDPGDRNRGLILNVDVPIYGFGSTSGRIQELKAQLDKSKRDLAAREVELAARLREAVRNVELARDRITIAEAALSLSQRSFEITENRFDSGLVDSRELLDAQLDLTRTRTERLNARIDYELALADLERITP